MYQQKLRHRMQSAITRGHRASQSVLYEVVEGLCGTLWSTGEHTRACIPAQRPTLSVSFSYFALLAESRCHWYCLKLKQLARVWAACSYKYCTFPPGCLWFVVTLAGCWLSNEGVCMETMECGVENTGRVRQTKGTFPPGNTWDNFQ